MCGKVKLVRLCGPQQYIKDGKYIKHIKDIIPPKSNLQKRIQARNSKIVWGLFKNRFAGFSGNICVVIYSAN